MYNKIVIGIDQSYKNTGISIAVDGELRKVTSKRLAKYESNSKRRRALANTLHGLLNSVTNKSVNIVCVIERIRLQSQGFINIDYIKSIGALNALIVDVCNEYGVEVFSVDTRSWKAQVVGTSKPKSNNFGVPDEKWPTVEWCISKGFESSILVEITGRKEKGTFRRNGKKYMYNDDAADSAGIAMYGFIGDEDKLVKER